MSDEQWFEYKGQRLELYHHLYNLTHLNERQVELAIALHWLSGRDPANGLEIGNVMGHYWPTEHFVVDLNEPPTWYQNKDNYANVDLFELEGHAPLRDWLVSLSTIEHTRNPAEAIGVLTGLAPYGLITFPTGVDPALDLWLESGAPGHYSVRTLCREQNGHGGWIETLLPQVRPYGPWANCVAVLEWGQP